MRIQRIHAHIYVANAWHGMACSACIETKKCKIMCSGKCSSCFSIVQAPFTTNNQQQQLPDEIQQLVHGSKRKEATIYNESFIVCISKKDEAKSIQIKKSTE